MIINSISLHHDGNGGADGTKGWFTDDFGKVYSIFEYIVRWINWKIDESSGDEYYYETYFHDYGRLERKKVMSSIGTDMLKFIIAHPKSHENVMNSLPEIVKLLESEHLLTFWLFMQKLVETNSGSDFISMEPFYDNLSGDQLRYFLLGATSDAPTTTTRASIASSQETKKIEMDHLSDFVESLIDHIASRYTFSTRTGDAFFGQNLDILSKKLYPECIGLVQTIINSSPFSLAPLINLMARLTTTDAFNNIIESEAFSDKVVVAKSLLVYWSVYPHLGLPGKELARTFIKAAGNDDWISRWLAEIGSDSISINIREFVVDL